MWYYAEKLQISINTYLGGLSWEIQLVLPDDFGDYVAIENAPQRFNEASEVAKKVTAAGVQLYPNLDHAAIFCDPPYIVAGPLKQLGYVSGWDARCYPSPVDGCDYINVSARLPEDSQERSNGWFDYVAVVHPVDNQALDHMLSQGYGNPFIHHLTWGIVPPERAGASDLDYAGEVVRFYGRHPNGHRKCHRGRARHTDYCVAAGRDRPPRFC